MNGLNLASLPEAGKPQGLEGMLQGSFKVSGPADSAALSASLRGTGIRAGGVPMNKLKLDLRGTTREIRVNRERHRIPPNTLPCLTLLLPGRCPVATGYRSRRRSGDAIEKNRPFERPAPQEAYNRYTHSDNYNIRPYLLFVKRENLP